MSEFQKNLFRRSLPREHGFEPLQLEGTLPFDLSGTLYRNGPGVFEMFGTRYDHPFEGEAVISAVRLKGGQAFGAAKVVESEGLALEKKRKKILFGGAAPWWRRMKNTHLGPDKITADTHVIPWQGRLLALSEGGKPMELDPQDLRTIGKTDLGGVVSSAFCAHPHRVASQKTTYNIGLEYGPKTRLHFYALPDQGAAKNLGAIDLAGPTLVHDFAMTQSHYILLISPIRFRLARFLLQLGGFGDWFSWEPSHGTEIIVAPIDRPSEATRMTVDPFFQYHFANAFERGSQIFVDYVRFQDMGPFTGLSTNNLEVFSTGRYHRGVIDLKRRSWSSSEISSVPCEFPRVHPDIEGREQQTTWLMRGDGRALLGLEPKSGKVSEHELPSGHWASEPVFVPRPGASGDERDGALLVMCHDDASDRGFVAVYKAAQLEEGPVARVWFDHYITSTFHGSWLPASD